jgi:excisionase family DNA binding protein
MATERQSFSPKEVAAILGCNIKTVYNGLKDKTIPSIRLGDLYIIPKPALDRLLNNGK